MIVILTLDASKTITDQIDTLKTQSKTLDILVIDSSSKDNTLEIVKSKNIDFIKIDRKEFNHASTRNLAKKYKADFYLFMTQDALPYDKHLVENLLKSFDNPDVVVSYARQIPYDDADYLERFARETNYPTTSIVKSKELLPKLGIKTFFCSNSCAMYRATYFKQVGGFKEGLNVNEDMEFASRAILNDKKIAYVCEAKVWHSHTYSVRTIFKRYFDIGVFFKINSHILEEVNRYSSTESTGIKQAKKELSYLLKKSPFSIPRSILFSLIKYISYKLGLLIRF